MAAKLTLTIEWDGPGTPVMVNGPIHDDMLCYALLEKAKDAIRAHQLTLQQQRIAVVPANGLPNGNGSLRSV